MITSTKLNYTDLLEYNDSEYCVYYTIYYGDAFDYKQDSKFSDENIKPFMYIGSTFCDNIKDHNYLGSISSKQYKKLWNYEKKNNTHLFEVIIIAKFSDRQDAMDYEKQLQDENMCMHNPLFFNKGLAGGVFGLSMKGESNGNYQRNFSEQHRQRLSESQKGKKRVFKDYDKFLENMQRVNFQKLCKTYKLTDRYGNVQLNNTGIQNFCEANNLTFATLTRFYNAGIVRYADNQRRFYSEKSRNCIGWSIELVDDDYILENDFNPNHDVSNVYEYDKQQRLSLTYDENGECQYINIFNYKNTNMFFGMLTIEGKTYHTKSHKTKAEAYSAYVDLVNHVYKMLTDAFVESCRNNPKFINHSDAQANSDGLVSLNC
jgi:hypothetical protein